MKTNKILKVVSVVILIIILILISFVGIYVKDNGRLVNIQKPMTKGAELGVEREYVFSVSEAVTTDYYDSEGNLVEEEDVDQDAVEGTYTTKEVSANPEEVKTVENYKIVKEVMEKRLQELGVEEYRLTLDEKTGDIVLKTAEILNTDSIVYGVFGNGEFVIKDAETQEVLLNNDDIKNVTVKYGKDHETNMLMVALSINLDKEGKEKLKNITSTYRQTTETKDVTAEDGTITQEKETVTKYVELYMDRELIGKQYFSEIIETGELQLTIQDGISDEEELKNVVLAANTEVAKIKYGPTPVIYEVVQSANILSNINMNFISKLEVIGIVLITAVLVYFVVRFKERAIIAGILFMGFTALYLLIMRYANVPITAASIFGFTFIEAYTLFFINRLLARLKNYDINEETPKSIINKTLLKASMILIPILIIGIVFSMFTSLAISSLGIILFWGIILFIIYSYLLGKTLLLNFEYVFENK